MSNYLRIDKADNVIIALENIGVGEVLEEGVFTLSEIPTAHKVASKRIGKGENIIKYGMPIGYALEDIAPGEHIHTHNMATHLSGSLQYEYKKQETPLHFKKLNKKVKVYRRSNGEIGIRNELYVIPTVGCSTATAQRMVQLFLQKQQSLGQEQLDIDGIHVFPHPYGCSQMGEDHINTKISLQQIARHPNAGGVLIVGLGCENNQVPQFMEGLEDLDSIRVRSIITQEVEDEIEEGVRLLSEIYEVMRKDQREQADLGEIRFGLECGGSDGFSGITGNVMLGRFSDILVANQGTTVLTEVPEMFGAEVGLMNRAKSQSVFQDIVTMVNDFKHYYTSHNQVIDENPSPGNKKGGITTLEEKSLGCCQKSGTSEITAVLKYGDRVEKQGVNLLSAPGNDLVATTALGMAGCQIVLFTTGRGTPFGGFIPTVKISTNTELFERKPHWIDFNAGSLAEGASLDQLTDDFIDYIVEVCNGELVNNEKNNFREIAIFKSGVTL